MPGDASTVDRDFLEDPEVVVLADDMGISREEALAMLDEQGKSLSYVDTVYSHPGFVDFRGPFGEGALLVVEPGFEDTAAFLNAPAELQVRAAPTTMDERVAAQQEVEEAAKAAAGSSLIGVAYDVFENSYSFWVKPDAWSAALEAGIEQETTSRLRSNKTATISVKEANPDLTDLRGGQTILRNSSLSTPVEICAVCAG